MFDPNLEKIIKDNMPKSVTELSESVNKQIKSMLKSGLKKLDVVGHAQFKNLSSSITKLKKRVDDIESQLEEQKNKPKSKKSTSKTSKKK